MARVWRDGQRHTVHIYRLLTTGPPHDICKLLFESGSQETSLDVSALKIYTAFSVGFYFRTSLPEIKPVSLLSSMQAQ